MLLWIKLSGLSIDLSTWVSAAKLNIQSGLYLKKIFLIFLISIITTSPYLIRNFLIFERIIIQAGFGYNVWKANNPNSKVEGSTIIDKNLQKKINSTFKKNLDELRYIFS